MVRYLAIAVVLGSLPPAAFAQEPLRIRGTCMGTTYALTIADFVEKPLADEITGRVGDELERIEQIFSLYRPGSELTLLNADTSGDWIGVSSDLLAVTKLAIELARETDGAFDPTVGPLIRLWRLRQVTSDWSPPSSVAIAEVQQRVGFRLLELREEQPAIHKLKPGVELDLNALVEGWAIDRVVDSLRLSGIRNALVELGGEFRAIGHKQNDQPWNIGLENPLATNSLYATASLNNAAIGTSGNYRQAIEYHGRRYGHILDARTGQPVEHNLIAVSVIADDAMTADGWATALMALGPNDGLALAEKMGLAASFFVREGTEPRVQLSTNAASRIRLKQ